MSVIVLAFLSLFTFIIGLAGYQANFIQLGLEQLFEAPSQYLGLFIHYAIWAFQSGSLSLIFISFLMLCSQGSMNRKTFNLALAATVLFTMLMAVLLLIGCLKRQWFHIEPGCQNPYKTVYNVIKFSKSHKHPLQRSAFTHNDDYIPSRLDFAKERFGGPFTTEQVENVKTFFWMLVILFAIGPSFALEVPASYFTFPLFGLHLLHPYDDHKDYKEYLKLMMGSGAMMNLTSIVILFPVYIWIIFYYLHKKIPKQFVRLGIGITLCLLGVVSLLVTDVVGHAFNRNSFASNGLCVFQAKWSQNWSLTYPSLDMHWAVLIPPSLLLGLGPFLVIATTLEFISAQSPQSMKGLLVGVFFAIRGLFQFLNSIIIIPLSLRQPWASREMIEHPPVTNCGFVYLALTSVTGLIGLVLFSLAAKRYKYRTRDEGIFCQHDVEEIYDRYIDQAASDSH
jgi:peptide/histidine transporter 3/4